MTKRNPLTWDQLPLYATDDEIGEAVLGWARKDEFSAKAQLHERHGMPKISPVWGGRYVPAVKAFLDAQNGVANATAAPLAPNGVEGNFHDTQRQAKGPRSQMAPSTNRPAGPVLVR